MSATTPRTPAVHPPRQLSSLEAGLTIPVSRPSVGVPSVPSVVPSVPAQAAAPAPTRPAPSSAPVLPAPVLPAALSAGFDGAGLVGTGTGTGTARRVLVPNVVLPGVTHAGVEALAADLGRHPELCLPDVKRVGHFTPLRYGRPVDAPLEEYDRHFSRWSGQRYRLENGSDYFDGGLPMARQMAENLPGARVVLVLRDPAQRLWAGYTDKLVRGRLQRAMGFEAYLERCLALRANGADRFEGNRHFRTLSSGFYVEYLPAWLETFGRRARVVFTEDLREAPQEHVGALFDWLGLDPADAVRPAGAHDEDGGGNPGYPDHDPGSLPFNRRFWPVLQRTAGPWRETGRTDAAPLRSPRRSERDNSRVRALYAGANRELAALLRDHGYSGLPEWLTRD